MSSLIKANGLPQPAVIDLLCFSLDALRLALPLASVLRVVRAAEVTPLAGAPDAVLGAINLAGQVIAVLDLRPRLRLPRRPIDPEQQLLIVWTGLQPLALLVDDVQDVAGYPAEKMVSSAQFVAEPMAITGLLRLDDGLLLITDPEHFLSLDETRALDRAFASTEVAIADSA